jgi:sulfonate transport system permease protein
VPLLLLWLGIDEAPKITLIAIGAFFPVYLNFVAGIQNVDRKLVEVGGIYGLTGYRLIVRIFLPAACPICSRACAVGCRWPGCSWSPPN